MQAINNTEEYFDLGWAALPVTQMNPAAIYRGLKIFENKTNKSWALFTDSDKNYLIYFCGDAQNKFVPAETYEVIYSGMAAAIMQTRHKRVVIIDRDIIEVKRTVDKIIDENLTTVKLTDNKIFVDYYQNNNHFSKEIGTNFSDIEKFLAENTQADQPSFEIRLDFDSNLGKLRFFKRVTDRELYLLGGHFKRLVLDAAENLIRNKYLEEFTKNFDKL